MPNGAGGQLAFGLHRRDDAVGLVQDSSKSKSCK